MTQSIEKSVVCPILIGRKSQMATLHDSLSQAANGRGQLILISGEAGVGKSRLVKETIAIAVQEGFTSLTGHCYETERAFPYAPLVDALSDFLAPHTLEKYPEDFYIAAQQFACLIPELNELKGETAPKMDPEQKKHRLFYLLTNFIRILSASRPLLFVIEDLHWCDESTLEFLLHLLQGIDSLSSCILLSYRAEETQASLIHFLAEIDRRRITTEISLPSLSRSEVDALLQTIFTSSRPVHAEFLNKIFDLTEGNPFFIEEILKLLISSGEIFYDGSEWDRKSVDQLHIPRSLQDAVQQRFESLSPRARQLLSVCSVAGDRFDITVLQPILQAREQEIIRWIKESITSQLILEVGEGIFAFRHALTRQAIYQGLLSIERKRLHLIIANQMEEKLLNAPPQLLVGTLVADLAYHYSQAGDWKKAIEYTKQAGEMAVLLRAPRDAIRFYTLAITASVKLASQADLECHRARGRCYEILGNFVSANEDYEQAFALAHAEQDLFAEWQILTDLGFLWASKNYARAGDFFSRSLVLAHEINQPTLLAHSLNRLGNSHVNTGDLQKGAREHQQALSIFQSQNDYAGVAESHDLLGVTYSLSGNLQASHNHFVQALALYRQLDDKRGVISCLASLNTEVFHSETAYWSPTTLTVCQKNAAEALRLAIELDWTAGQAQVEWATGGMLATFGELGEGLAHARKALEIATRIDHRQWMTASYSTLGVLETMLLLPQKAIATLEKGLSLANELGSAYWIGHITAHLALAYLLEKDWEGSERILQSAGQQNQDLETQVIQTLSERDITWAWGETLQVSGQPGKALAIAEQLLATDHVSYKLTEAWVDQGRNIPFLLKLKGDALKSLNRCEEAEQALERAISGANQRHAWTVLWQIQRSLGQLALHRRRWKSAEDYFSSARAIIHSLARTIDDPDLFQAFLQTALASMPAEKLNSSRRRSPYSFGGLTEREHQVAALIAQGKSNREIADKLVLSERTIENHIARILNRLEFELRAQIAAWVIKVGLEMNEQHKN